MMPTASSKALSSETISARLQLSPLKVTLTSFPSQQIYEVSFAFRYYCKSLILGGKPLVLAWKYQYRKGGGQPGVGRPAESPVTFGSPEIL